VGPLHQGHLADSEYIPHGPERRER
jgi:hypothetical protein